MPVRMAAAIGASLYGWGVRVRRGLYARKWLSPKRLPAPVVSVGNLTVGGAGKTPMVACLARFFQDRGNFVAILSRGYGGKQSGVTRLSDGLRLDFKPPEVGEEAYWLARTLPGVAVYTGACRYAAGMAAWEDLNPDLFLLDDGFQHLKLHRDLDLVLLDAASPFGNGCLLPRGPLREPVSALAAAHILILTRFREESHQARLQALKKMFPQKTVLTAAVEPTKVRCYPAGEESAPATLKGRPLLAFAGLARPEVFTRTLSELGVELKGFHAFSDHYAFKEQDLQRLLGEAYSQGAAGLVTTAKDWARLGEKWEAGLPLWVLEVEARLHQPLPGEFLAGIGEGGPGT